MTLGHQNSMKGLGILAVEDLAWSANALDRLGELRAARDLIDYMIDSAVEECRRGVATTTVDDVEAAGGLVPASWAKIAGALGISRQTAWQRFRRVEN